MAFFLREQVAQWRMLSPASLSLGLQTKAPIDPGTAMKGLDFITREFPDLVASDYSDSEKVFSLRSDDAEAAQQILFTLRRHETFQLAWGHERDVDLEQSWKGLVTAAAEGFEVSSVNLDWIDMRLVAVSRWEGQHYAAIGDAFLKNSPIGDLFQPSKFLQNDLFVRGLIDDTIEAAAGVYSDVSDREVVTGRFENDTLTVLGAVRQTRIPSGANMVEVALELTPVAIEFFARQFIPKVAKPLDDALARSAESPQVAE